MSKKCNHCYTNTQNTETMKEIPLVAAECEAARQHQTIKRLIYSIMILTALLFGSNLAWILCGVRI